MTEDESLYDLPEDPKTQTQIQNRYCFWCHRRGGKSLNNYQDGMKQVCSFQTVEHFWRIYNHLIRPNDFKTTTDYQLFKNGITPTWEDAQNERGGKWMVRLKKGLASRYWEELILAIIGEQFDVGHEICGAVVSIRHNEDIISVWNKNAENTEAKNKIRDQLRRILKLPAFIPIEYKKHQDSIVDKSSFRNTDVWRSSATSRPKGDWSGEGGDRRHYHGHHHGDDREGNTRNRDGEKEFGRGPRSHGGQDRSSNNAWKSARYTSGDRDGAPRSGAPREGGNRFNSGTSGSAWGKSSSAGDKSGGGWYRGKHVDEGQQSATQGEHGRQPYKPAGHGGHTEAGETSPRRRFDRFQDSSDDVGPRRRGGSGGGSSSTGTSAADDNMWRRGTKAANAASEGDSSRQS
mmetsp:Transcript_13002/g.19609  ORF Transcript_13002/g.19609 Transcript_13002/m.19609 type:complete len:403 (+) Transcript_13002:54-1262(+)